MSPFWEPSPHPDPLPSHPMGAEREEQSKASFNSKDNRQSPGSGARRSTTLLGKSFTVIGGLHRVLATAICLLACFSIKAQTTNSPTGQSILQDLENFRETGSVLYVAAHPDDENNELIAYLSRGRHYRTAYLSLTRGDGGQNVLGPVFGEELGVVRTEELLAAGRIDGAQQYFSRAMDFGFSKDYRQTLKTWDKDEVLSDIVRVIREFRPDVVVTRFPHSGRNAWPSHGLCRSGAAGFQTRRRSTRLSGSTERRADTVAAETHFLECWRIPKPRCQRRQAYSHERRRN